jgi:molybdate transport system ATP-binding protein
MGEPLSVRVGKRLGDFHLDCAFEGPGRGVTCLFGASGAGKSATLAAVAGSLRPDAGRIAIGSDVLFDAEARIDRQMEQRGVGWVFQDARLFPHLSVEKNLRYGLSRVRGRPVHVGFDEVLAVLGVEALLARRPRDLSGGERQRVAIGRALLSQPRLLLMDEPLSALDAARKAEILPFLERLKGVVDLPILYVTHNLSEVMRLADRLVVMDAGKVAAQGPLAEVLARADVPLLAARADAAAALDAVVAGHDRARGLTRLDVQGVTLLTPALDRAVGSAVRAVVLARDVLLAGEAPRALSARNVMPGSVQRLTTRADGSVLVTVALADGPARILSAVTRDAVEDLGLAPGKPVWAVVKSVAVEGAAGGGMLTALDD